MFNKKNPSLDWNFTALQKTYIVINPKVVSEADFRLKRGNACIKLALGSYRIVVGKL